MSLHLFKTTKSKQKTPWNLKRPCLKGINTLILSDSTLRTFARMNRTFPGTAIVAYSGAEILELSMIIRAGSLNKDIDLEVHDTRERILNGRDEIPIVRWCYQCKDECYDKFNGKILFFIGLNNSLHAADWPFVQENKQTRLMENVQVRFRSQITLSNSIWLYMTRLFIAPFRDLMTCSNIWMKQFRRWFLTRLLSNMPQW